ncbi:MAG: hypothetical protein ACK5JG_16795, partial [Pseudomonadota bacterium]
MVARVPEVLGVVLVAAAAIGVSAGEPADRRALAAERQRLTAQFDAEAAQCRERFAVNDCIADVRRRQRAALAPLRESELLLEEAGRRERAAQRRLEVQRRQAEAAARPMAGASAPSAPGPRPAAELRRAPAASAPPVADGPDPFARREALDRAAEQRALDAARRR